MQSFEVHCDSVKWVINLSGTYVCSKHLLSFMTLSEPFPDESIAVITVFYALHSVSQMADYSHGVTCYLICLYLC